MDLQEVLIVITFYMEAIVLLWLLFVEFPRLRIEQFRDDLFALRDVELFDYMRKENLPIESKYYTELRGFINFLLLWADKANFVNIVLLELFLIPYYHSWRRADKLSFSELIANIEDSAVRAHFREVDERLTKLLLKKIAPFGLVSVLGIVLALLRMNRSNENDPRVVENLRTFGESYPVTRSRTVTA